MGTEIVMSFTIMYTNGKTFAIQEKEKKVAEFP